MATPPTTAAPTKPPRHPWVEKDTAAVPDASKTALRQAMQLEGTPPAQFDDLLWIMAQESEGQVDLKNPKSTARGLFQLTAAGYANNPNGTGSFGNAVEECQGGLRYIKGRYGDAATAKAFWLVHKWY